jgi:membrane protease YdiL (CAAX protease family)
MNKAATLFNRHPLVTFTVLTYAFSWLLWFLSASTFMIWLGGFGPALAAIALTALLDGQAGLRRLLGQVLIWRVHLVWYLLALGLPLIGTVIVIVLYALRSEAFSHLQMLATWFSGLGQRTGFLGLTLLFGMFVVIGEELGWRGFVLPRLQARYSDLSASLITGLLWGLWHLPNLWPFQPDREAVDLFLFLADILVISILYTWLYINSRGSLLIICLFHAAYNVMVMYASATIPFLGETKGYELLALLLIAGAIVIGTNPRRFTRSEERPLTVPQER